MRSKILVTAILLTSLCYAKEPKHYQTGTLLQMDSVACGVDEKDGKSLTGEMLGTDSGSKKTHELLCQEYLLQSEHVIYRIRPRDEKHPVLLPVGEQAQYRIQKDKMLLRRESAISNKLALTIHEDGAGDTPRHLFCTPQVISVAGAGASFSRSSA